MATSETSAEGQRLSAPSAPPKVSIVVPAYREASRIGASITRIDEFLSRAPFDAELLVVDDGSPDETSYVASRTKTSCNMRLIRYDRNHGKGFAVRKGVRSASGEYVLFTDADLSAPIEEMEKLLAAAEQFGADVVIGSRALDRTLIETHQSPLREMGGIVFNWMVRLLLGLRLHDTQCGFKLFKRTRIQPVFDRLTITGFGFDPELLFVAKRARLKIIEVPVRWSHAEGSKIRFFRDGTRMFADLVRIRWNSMKGMYS
jgi:glycosyltransferase involved in cell wall biosynthesis